MAKTRLGKKATKAKAAHMSIKYPLLVIYFLSIISCRSINSHHIKMYKDTFPVISFCDLPNHKGKQVYVKGYYSGILEYWTFNNGGKVCDQKFSTDLQFEGSNPFNPPQKFEIVFNEAFNNYQTSFLVIEAVGIFENDREGGYGHLGSNDARFIVTDLISAKLIKR